jgi:hypothetical protein
MSLELVAIVAILVTSLLEVSGLLVMGGMLYRMWSKMDAGDAALYLQGRRVEDVLREMRAELRGR